MDNDPGENPGVVVVSIGFDAFAIAAGQEQVYRNLGACTATRLISDANLTPVIF
jgi:hypothetical protein